MSDQPTDRQLAVQIAERALGSREKALEMLLDDPDAVTPETIAAERHKMQRATDAEARAAHEASPAGRREKAQAALEAREQEKRDAVLARELLIQEGQATEADLASLRPHELIELAGMHEPAVDKDAYVAPETTPLEAAAQGLRAKWFQLAAHERVRIAQEQGIDAETFARSSPTPRPRPAPTSSEAGANRSLPDSERTDTVKTQTPRNPKNEGSYALHELKPVERKTRFARTANFEGRAATPAQAIAAAYRELSQEQLRQAKPIRAERGRQALLRRPQLRDRRRHPRSARRLPGRHRVRARRPNPQVHQGAEGDRRRDVDRLALEPDLEIRDEAIWTR